MTENLNYAWKSNAETLSLDQLKYNGENRKPIKNIFWKSHEMYGIIFKEHFQNCVSATLT